MPPTKPRSMQFCTSQNYSKRIYAYSRTKVICIKCLNISGWKAIFTAHILSKFEKSKNGKMLCQLLSQSTTSSVLRFHHYFSWPVRIVGAIVVLVLILSLVISVASWRLLMHHFGVSLIYPQDGLPRVWSPSTWQSQTSLSSVIYCQAFWVAQVPTLPLWVRIRNSAATPHTEPRLEGTTFILPHWTHKPQKTTAPDPKKLRKESPQSFQTMGSMVRFFSRSYDIVECFLWLLRLTASAAGLLHEV